MSEIKIDLNGMSLLDVIKAYPEQVLRAIEQHNMEAQKTPTNAAMVQLLFDVGIYLSANMDCEENRIDIINRINAVLAQQQHG